ncbi:MAG: hypothetical protein J5589_05890 [Firmicutes bacterium]|nr:hypothetical protein [Bacillota bacterium]
MIYQELLTPNPEAALSSFEELRQTLTDLDLTQVLCLIDPRMDQKAASSFAGRYFSSDSAEIAERSAFLKDLSALTDADSLQKGIDAIYQLDAENQKALIAPTRFQSVLYRWRRLAAYRKVVLSFCAILSPKTADGSALSRRCQILTDYFRSLREEPFFASLEEALGSLDQALPLPRYIQLGFNMREDGYPQEMGIIGAEGHIDLRKTDFASEISGNDNVSDDSEIPLNALLSFDDPSLPSKGLGPEFIYNRGLYGSHFDEYIEHAAEKQWKAEIGRAEKILDKLQPKGEKLKELDTLLSLREPLSFYQIGLLCLEAFEKRGYSLCIPEPLPDTPLIIREALYPDFILQHEGIRGNDLTLKRGNAVIITGANHSGKTSYLKTIGQCTALAQLGFFVPAKEMIFTPVTHIFTLFSAGEDSSMNASRMGLEVKKLTAILKKATDTDLILLNEPMTSTNPVEAVSICADMTRHFLEKNITHLLVTHLYDIYFLLKAELKPELLKRLDSLVTESSYDPSTGQMVHAYKLYYHEPLGNSYARETATAYGITLEDMIASGDLLLEARSYVDSHNIDSIYEGGEADGISDDH